MTDENNQGDDELDHEALAAEMEAEEGSHGAILEESEDDTEDEDFEDEGEDESDDDEKPDDDDDSDSDDEDEAPAAKRVEFTPEQQEVFDATVGKKAAKLRETEQALEAAQRELQEKEAVLARFQEPQRPELPPEPDPDSYDYQEQQQRYAEGLRAQATYDARQEVLQQQKEAAEQQQRAAEEAVVMQAAQSYQKQAETLKVDPVRLRAAGEIVSNYGIPDDLAMHIMSDPQGPELTLYLGEHPLELDEVVRLPPMRAAIHLEKMKAKIIETRSSGKRPPKPTKTPKSSSAPARGEDGKYGKVF